MTAAERPVLRPRGKAPEPVPYVLTPAGEAALAAWPGNRVEHEPRRRPTPCDGRGCRCVSGRWSR